MTTTRASSHPSPLDDSSDCVPLSDPPKRTYTSADYETAFHVWHGPAGKNLHTTSAILGISVSTLHHWFGRHDWASRSATLSEGSGRSAAAIADRIVQDLIVAGQVPAIIALHEIMADPGHKRRDVAAFGMLALGGRPLPKAPVISASKTLADGTVLTVKASDVQHLSSEELTHFARTGEMPASIPATREDDPA